MGEKAIRRESSAPVQVKAAKDFNGRGEVSALVAVFGNVDLYGDRIVKGAFKSTIEDWEAKGDPVPFIWSHRWDDPMYHLGGVEEAKETDDGLVVKASMDTDTEIGAQVFRLLKERRVTQFSFAYDVNEYSYVEESEDSPYEVRELKALGLIEVGPTLMGANPATELYGAKALVSAEPPRGTYVLGDAAVRALGTDGLKALGIEPEVKAGRVLSKTNESKIRAAVEALSAVLDALPEADEDAKSTAASSRERDLAVLRALELAVS